MRSCDELKQQSCCNSLSLCHSHTVTLVCDELLGGLPSQRGSPLSLGTGPTHAAERWQQHADVCVVASSRFRLVPTAADLPRAPGLYQYVFSRVCFSIMHLIYVPNRHNGCLHLRDSSFCLVSDVCDAWSISMWWWDDPVVIQKLDGIIIYSERRGVCRLFQTHVNAISTLYMLYSHRWTWTTRETSNDRASFGNDPSSTFSIMALQHSTGLTEKQQTRFKWPQFVSLWF